MIFQHVGHEPLGTLNPLLKAAGFRIRYVNFGRHPDLVPNLDGYSGLIILGGPMGVYESHLFPHLLVEMKTIEEALKRQIPVLGICLGAQLLAATLGGRVEKAPHVEVGWHEVRLTEEGAQDLLFADFKSPEMIFQLHQDHFEPPKAGVHLAMSQLCEGQAFRYGEKAYGFQFHLEADRPMILRWLKQSENQDLLDRARPVTAEAIRLQMDQYIDRSVQLSEEIFKKFIALFNLPQRQTWLGSTHGGPKKKRED